MICGIGIDIIEIERVKNAIARHPRLIDRIFNLSERDYCLSKKNSYASFAARFAAKEAFLKAIGTGWGKGMRWNEVWIESGLSGEPILHTTGAANKALSAFPSCRLHVSLTHNNTTASAVVLIEST